MSFGVTKKHVSSHTREMSFEVANENVFLGVFLPFVVTENIFRCDNVSSVVLLAIFFLGADVGVAQMRLGPEINESFMFKITSGIGSMRARRKARARLSAILVAVIRGSGRRII